MGSGVVRPSLERVVPPLAMGTTDRMDGREVDDVESELGELRELFRDALEAAPGAREELVPAAEARPLAVDVQLERHDRRLGAALLFRRRRRIEPLLDGER